MWDNIIGHRQQKEFLERYLVAQERPHALLFVGAEGLGKKQLALATAKALLCEQHTAADNCESCRLMDLERGNLSHPDFLMVKRETDPKTGRLKDISIEQIKDLITKSSFAPTMGETKVCILEDVDRMSVAAANAFLKLLEEPPAGWVLILIATSEDKLLTTILSRVVRLRFQAVTPELVEQFLLTQGVAADQTAVLARVSEGSIGLALNLPQAQFFEWREQAKALLEAMPLNTPLNYLANRSWQQKTPERPDALMLVRNLQLLLHDLLMCRNGLTTYLYNSDLQEELQSQAGRWREKALKQSLLDVQNAYSALEASTGVKVVLEALTLEINKNFQ